MTMIQRNPDGSPVLDANGNPVLVDGAQYMRTQLQDIFGRSGMTREQFTKVVRVVIEIQLLLQESGVRERSDDRFQELLNPTSP